MDSLQNKFVDKIGMSEVCHYISGKLRDYDTTLVEWIKLLPLEKRVTLHGECKYPVRTQSRARTFKRGYRIRASVNVEIDPPYVHDHWGRIPSSNYQQGWYSGPVSYQWETLDECAVHTLAHECFHFLSHSKQITIKNVEANANWFADQWLEEYQNM